MTTRRAPLLVAAVLGLASLAAAQTPRSPEFATNGGLKPPSKKELIYVALPGTLRVPGDENGSGIVVLDASNGFRFVKRIHNLGHPRRSFPEQVAGITASPVTEMVYVATRGRLAAWNLMNEQKVWENTFDGNCCERPQVSPDGTFMYVGSDLKDYWYVVNPTSGQLITKVVSPKSPGAHNLNLSLDGKIALMSPNGKTMAIGDTTHHTLIKTITFPDNVRVFVINHDASLIYTNLNNFFGYVVADVATGQIVQRVQIPGYGWPDNWNVKPRPRIPHACPCHGIALTNDEKEVWVDDGLNNLIHIFDNTQVPAREIATIKTTGGCYWITVGVGGKLAYCSSGDVIDMKSRQIVGQLKDEYGRIMRSEKLLDCIFTDGRLTAVSNQFGNGQMPASKSLAYIPPQSAGVTAAN